ncbi:uncharacterized protein TEOVI_000020700 [Trypanosoma equiperdum]|uniref:Trypanosome variant surface glycoprotein (A-type) n=1 Tax=Trypanosoma equiperdum TaxID=5694 RepID=A0A1G4I1B9_TRYEQ|nr:hypothetical protein, conserved [Trypanosoma equiperdum]
MSFARRKTAAITVLATLISVRVTEAQLAQTAVDAVSKLCTEKVHMLKLKEQFESAISRAVESVNALNKEARTYELASAAVKDL